MTIADCGLTDFEFGVRGNNFLNSPEDDDEEDAEFHQGEGPELHRAKGDGCEND